MRGIKTQYFLSFSVMGSLLPFFSVYLREQGLTRPQIGYVTSTASVAVLLTPVVVTFLADGWVKGRHLLAAVFVFSGVILASLLRAEGFWSILFLFAIFSLTFAPVTALQDGLQFLTQQKNRREGRPIVPYHLVRVWGTVGFIVPSVLLFEFLRRGQSTRVILVSAMFFCALGAMHTLSPARRAKASPTPDDLDHARLRRRDGQLPTVAAMKAMSEPHVLVFCLAMLLMHMASASYYSFYPLYLTDRVGLGSQWVGVIANIGVGLEIAYMLGFGRLLARWGLKGLMIMGAASMVLRFGLLAASDTIAVAVGTQIVHGVMVLVVHVAPPIFLNRHAEDRYRNSMQGLYVMGVYGCGRILGNLLAGHVAHVSLAWMFCAAAVLCGLALALFSFAFHDRDVVEADGSE